MFLHEIIRFIFSTMESGSVVILSLALFRIPFRYSLNKVLIIGIILSFISLIQRDYLHLETFVTISLIIANVILFKFIFNFPTFYALLVSITGYLIFAVIQTILVVVSTLLGITTIDMLGTSLLHGSMIQFISACLSLLFAYWIQYKKIGFMFVISRLSIKHTFVGYNLILSIVILMTLITVQLLIISFQDNTSLIVSLLGLILFLISVLTVTYRKNKNDIKEKYNRLKRK